MKTILLITLLSFLLFSTGAHAQTTYEPKHNADKEIGEAKAELALLLQKRTTVYDNKNDLRDKPEDILVLDDRIEFMIKNKKSVINFSDLSDYHIESKENRVMNDDGSVRRYYYNMKLGNFIFLYGNDPKAAKAVADDLFIIQQQFREKTFSSQLILFEPVAAQYRALKEKPPVSEEQRKYIVQANSFNQEKNYAKAIELYNKAVELDQTAYPTAYSNLALLSAQLQKFDAAIYYMKEYLMLEPEVSDARGARDKIYEWEAKLVK